MTINKFNIRYFSKYRTELMGISALLILFCHSIAYIKMPNILYYIISFGNIGVDFFLFLSGIGIWYSLSKRNNKIYKWYIDRYKKLFIPYFTVLLSMEIVQFCLGKQLEHGIWNYIFELSSLRFYVSHDAPWFIAALIPLYFLAPCFFFLIKKYHWKSAIVLILIHYLILFIPPVFTSELANNLLNNIQFVSVRATCFILGMALGQYSKIGYNISMWWMVIGLISGIIAIIITSHLVYGYFFFTLPLLCVFCYLITICSKHLKVFFGIMGKISLESYILNGALPSLMISVFITLGITSSNNIAPYILACILGIILSYFFHAISTKMVKNC